ncbi:MAG: hypothetical protein ABI634_08475 [Acidobacteriota bacterium]
MLTRLFKAVTPQPVMAQAPSPDSLWRACDAIMHSRERPEQTSNRLSSFRLDTAAEPPAAAIVELVFRRQHPSGLAIDIPRGTRVSTSDVAGAGVTFMTGRTARIEPGQDAVHVLAYHAEFVNGELLGFTTGMRRTLSVARVPIVEATTADIELVIGVSCDASEIEEGDRVVIFDGRPFRLWAEVGSAWVARTGGRLFIADRLSGDIALLPQARREADAERAQAPNAPIRREIRAWYWRGGGLAGNVPANALSVLRDSLRSVVVTNPMAARGGREAPIVEPVTDRVASASRAVMA